MMPRRLRVCSCVNKFLVTLLVSPGRGDDGGLGVSPDGVKGKAVVLGEVFLLVAAKSHICGLLWLPALPFCWVAVVPAVVRPVNISSVTQSLSLAFKNSPGIEARHTRAVSPVYISVCNKLPDKFLWLFSEYLSAAKRDRNNLQFLKSAYHSFTPSWAARRRLQRSGRAASTGGLSAEESARQWTSTVKARHQTLLGGALSSCSASPRLPQEQRSSVPDVVLRGGGLVLTSVGDVKPGTGPGARLFIPEFIYFSWFIQPLILF